MALWEVASYPASYCHGVSLQQTDMCISSLAGKVYVCVRVCASVYMI